MADSVWKDKTLGVIGGGNMAEALIRGVVASGLVPAERITVYDILPVRREVFSAIGCRAVEEPAGAWNADAVLLATKPQNLGEAVKDAVPGRDRVVISILAGVPCARFETLLGADSRVVRVMPNTPLLVGLGMAALAPGRNATSGDMALARALFESAGEAVEVPEDKLDAVTALSGSGPAYLFAFAEALAAGGETIGLDRDLAQRLVAGTLRGAAEMLCRHGNPAKLREQVTSPGGTTAAALKIFGGRDLDGIAAEALTAARDRSLELGRGE